MCQDDPEENSTADLTSAVVGFLIVVSFCPYLHRCLSNALSSGSRILEFLQGLVIVRHIVPSVLTYMPPLLRLGHLVQEGDVRASDPGGEADNPKPRDTCAFLSGFWP